MTDNYKKWTWDRYYSLESIGLWDYTLTDKKNYKPVAIDLKATELPDDVKLNRWEEFADKTIDWTKNNVKFKSWIGLICLGHVQQEFQNVKTEWLAHDLLEWLKKRYNLQNTVSKWATITSIDELTCTSYKKKAEYRLKYYFFKASIKKNSIITEDVLKIRMLNNLSPAFKTYLTVVNNWIQKDKKLEEDDILFKAIREEKTRIKADHKASASFASTKSNAKPQRRAAQGKKRFVE